MVIIEEPTATEVASVSRKFPAHPNIAFTSFQAENYGRYTLYRIVYLTTFPVSIEVKNLPEIKILVPVNGTDVIEASACNV